MVYTRPAHNDPANDSSATDATVIIDALSDGLEAAEATIDGLPATYQSLDSMGLARFISRARAGEDLSITCLGDSILEGETTTTPATDAAMVLLAADLSSRFGVTVTVTNHAVSGRTAARSHFNTDVAAAIAEYADLYIVSAYDKNDIGSDVSGPYAAGYPLAASTAAVERIIRAIRTEVPKADIIVMSTNPYVSGSSLNPYQQAKDAAEQSNAAVYGCEWVDCYSAFVALGDYSTHMADSTHPNTLGHRLIADTILAHIPDADCVPLQPGAVPVLGVHSPEVVDTTAGVDHGYATNATPGVEGDVSYVTGGVGWSSEATSTAGDYVECAAYCTELQIQVSTAVIDACVVDIAVDGMTVESSLDLSATGGKNGTYWIPFVTGLAAGDHSLRLTLVSGTLRTSATGALIAPSAEAFGPEVSMQIVHAVSATTTMTTSYQAIGAATAVPLPAGWGSMDLMLSGYATVRCSGATTAARRIDVALRNSGATIQSTRQHGLWQATATTNFPNVSLDGALIGLSGDASIEVIAKVDNATDTIQTLSVYTNALLVRAS